MLAEEKKKRPLENLRVGQESPSPTPGADGKTKDLAPKGRSTEIAGRAVGVGKTSVDRAIEAKKEHPELFEKAKRGETTVTAASEGRTPKAESAVPLLSAGAGFLGGPVSSPAGNPRLFFQSLFLFLFSILCLVLGLHRSSAGVVTVETF